MKNKPTFTPIGNILMEQKRKGLRFMAMTSPPFHCYSKHACMRSYLLAKNAYRLPMRIDMTITIDAPYFSVMLGETGRINFCSLWDDNRRIKDIAEPLNKPFFFANHMPLNTPTDITIIYNKKSMQILINGKQRYFSVKEKYMKSALFQKLNAAGFKLWLTGGKRTEVLLHSFTVTESENEFEIIKQEFMPDPITSNIPLPLGVKLTRENILASLGGKLTFEDIIAGLPADIHAKVIEVDSFLRLYKPLKFQRIFERNGNKITYVASKEGFSYSIRPSRNLLTHDFCWYILTNSQENWGKRISNRMIETLEKLAGEDPEFAARIISYTKDCVDYSPKGICHTPYKFRGKARLACHGKIEFKMELSEFDDVMRFISAI